MPKKQVNSTPKLMLVRRTTNLPSDIDDIFIAYCASTRKKPATAIRELVVNFVMDMERV